VIFLIINFFGNLPLPLFGVCILIMFDWGIKLNVNGFANSFSLDAGLNAVESEPFGVIRAATKLIDEFGVLHNFHMLIVILEGRVDLWLRLHGRSPFQMFWSFLSGRQIICQIWIRLIVFWLSLLDMVDLTSLIVTEDNSVSVIGILFIISAERSFLL
jgi:hypothetical protein